MKTLLPSLAASGTMLAVAMLFLAGTHVDSVSSASYFYTNASRTGWYYPKNNTYTSEFVIGERRTIPVVYAGGNQDDACTWIQTPALGGTFAPADSSISSYRWTPAHIGAFNSTFKVQKQGESDGYSQSFHFLVVPEPGIGLALIACVAAWRMQRRIRSRHWRGCCHSSSQSLV